MKKIIVVGSVLAWAGIASAVLLMQQDFNDSKGAASSVDRADSNIRWGGSFLKAGFSEGAPVNGGGCSGQGTGDSAMCQVVNPYKESLKSFTVGGWVKIVVASGQSGNTALFHSRGTAKNGFGLSIDNKSAEMVVLIESAVKKLEVPLPLDTWTFVVMTYDGTNSEENNLKLYMSTGPESLALIGEFKVKHNQVSVTGNNFNVGSKGLSGLADNIRLYGSVKDGSGALAEEEIKVWMQGSDMNEGTREGLKVFKTVGAMQLFNAGFLR